MRKLTSNSQLFKVVEAKTTAKNYRKTISGSVIEQNAIDEIQHQAMNTGRCIPYTELSADGQWLLADLSIAFHYSTVMHFYTVVLIQSNVNQ